MPFGILVWHTEGVGWSLNRKLELEPGANRTGLGSFQKSLDPESWVGGGTLAQVLFLPIFPRPSATHVSSIITCPLRPGPTRPRFNLNLDRPLTLTYDHILTSFLNFSS